MRAKSYSSPSGDDYPSSALLFSFSRGETPASVRGSAKVLRVFEVLGGPKSPAPLLGVKSPVKGVKSPAILGLEGAKMRYIRQIGRREGGHGTLEIAG